MAPPLAELQLGEIGLERLQRTFERAALRLHRCQRRRGHFFAQLRVAEQRADGGGEPVGIGNLFGAMGGIERLTLRKMGAKE